MNEPGITPVGRYQGVDFFNGGLFSVIHPIELTPEELKFLEVAAKEDWIRLVRLFLGIYLKEQSRKKSITRREFTTLRKRIL